MRYPAIITKEGRFIVAVFPDCPGCATQADPGESIEAQATEALTGWLETTQAHGEVPPRPRSRAKGKVLWVEVPANVAVKIAIRWARTDAGMTQRELAKRAGVTQQQIAKLEHPDANPSVDTLMKVAAALGARLAIDIHPLKAA